LARPEDWFDKDQCEEFKKFDLFLKKEITDLIKGKLLVRTNLLKNMYFDKKVDIN
jgi:hypothetical protein